MVDKAQVFGTNTKDVEASIFRPFVLSRFGLLKLLKTDAQRTTLALMYELMS